MAPTTDFRFTAETLNLAAIERHTAAMWSDLAFDYATLAALKRDGISLDGVRLTGPCPYVLTQEAGGKIRVALAGPVTTSTHANALIDLWRVHFMRGLRPGSIAA